MDLGLDCKVLSLRKGLIASTRGGKPGGLRGGGGFGRESVDGKRPVRPGFMCLVTLEEVVVPLGL